MTYQPGPGHPGNPPAPGQYPQDPQQPYPAFEEQPAFAPPPPSNDKLNGLAVGSLITGLIGCISLVGLILGIIALRQIGQRGGRGRGLAIAGIVLFCVWAVIGVAGLLLSDSFDTTGTRAGTATSAPTQTGPKRIRFQKMEAGQCINDDVPGGVNLVSVVPCDQPHDGEVLATGTLHGLILPSDEQIKQQARVLCSRLMGDKLERDPAADVLTTLRYYPDAQGWRRGDHRVACLAAHVTDGKKLTRPIRTG